MRRIIHIFFYFIRMRINQWSVIDNINEYEIYAEGEKVEDYLRDNKDKKADIRLI